MTTEWAHLPNANHIDAVLAHVKVHPNKWVEAWYAAQNETWNAARNETRNAAWNATRNETRNAAWNAARNKAWDAAWNAAQNEARYAANNAARDAILALTAYDDCAYLLDSAPDELRVIIALSGDTNPAAILLLSAVIAFHNELVLA